MATWRNFLHSNAPTKNTLMYGWEKDASSTWCQSRLQVIWLLFLMIFWKWSGVSDIPCKTYCIMCLWWQTRLFSVKRLQSLFRQKMTMMMIIFLNIILKKYSCVCLVQIRADILDILLREFLPKILLLLYHHVWLQTLSFQTPWLGVNDNYIKANGIKITWADI